MVRDSSRTVVYSVEDAWSNALDRGGRLDFFGSSLHVPTQRVFGDLATMQRYTDHWIGVARLGAFPGISDVRLRPRRGARKAHYERGGVIAIPMESPWACRESVVLHEVSHHLVMSESDSPHRATPGDPSHGPHFLGAMCWLVEEALGPEAALLLRTGYQGSGLEVRGVN
jgi:putative metallohydrolase (TIGR04338 family)